MRTESGKNANEAGSDPCRLFPFEGTQRVKTSTLLQGSFLSQLEIGNSLYSKCAHQAGMIRGEQVVRYCATSLISYYKKKEKRIFFFIFKSFTFCSAG